MELQTSTNHAEQLKAMPDEELKALQALISDELASRKETVTVELEAKDFDSRKHGQAYVAILTYDDDGRVQRRFVEHLNRHYDGKRKYYDANWRFEAKVGTVLEARLSDGSWKNDYRQYFVVESDNIRSVDYDEAVESIEKGA